MRQARKQKLLQHVIANRTDATNAVRQRGSAALRRRVPQVVEVVILRDTWRRFVTYNFTNLIYDPFAELDDGNVRRKLENCRAEALVEAGQALGRDCGAVAIDDALVAGQYWNYGVARVEIVDNGARTLELEPVQDRLERVEEDLDEDERRQGGVDLYFVGDNLSWFCALLIVFAGEDARCYPFYNQSVKKFLSFS